MGFCKTQLENFAGENGAFGNFNKALELNPKKIEAIYGRAFTKNKLGDSRGAIEDYSSAIEMDNTKNVKIIYDKKMTKNIWQTELHLFSRQISLGLIISTIK